MNITDKYIRTIEDFYAANLLTLGGKMNDYSEEGDPFSNFRFASQCAGITVEQGFLFLLGVKMARLKNLLVNAKTPQNESVVDTLGDSANYDAILAAYLKFENEPLKEYSYLPAADEPLAVTVAPPGPPIEPENLDPLEKLRSFFNLGKAN